MLGLTALQSTTASTVNITTVQTVATYSNGAGVRKLRPMVVLSSLNGAAATITVRIRQTTDGGDVWSTSVTKGAATDTRINVLCPSFYAAASKDYAILILSSNASDTSVTWAVDWFDDQQADAIAWGGVAVTGMPMPTYTQPTGFLAATFPGTVSSYAGGAVASVTGNVGGNVVGSVGSVSGVSFPANFSALGINASGHVSRVTLVDTTTTLTNAPSSITPAQVWAYTGGRTLTSGVVTVVKDTQTGSMTVIQGDSYLYADGTNKTVTKASGAVWPNDLAGWTITFTATPTTDTLTNDPNAVGTTATGTVVTATGDAQAIRFDMLATATAALTEGVAAYDYDVQASSGAARRTLETGTMTVRAQVTTA